MQINITNARVSAMVTVSAFADVHFPVVDDPSCIVTQYSHPDANLNPVTSPSHLADMMSNILIVSVVSFAEDSVIFSLSWSMSINIPTYADEDVTIPYHSDFLRFSLFKAAMIDLCCGLSGAGT